MLISNATSEIKAACVEGCEWLDRRGEGKAVSFADRRSAAENATDRVVKPSLRNSLSLLICVTRNFAHVN